VLAARHALYQEARQRNPQRWSGSTRNWTPVGAVTLNPERDSIVRAATSQIVLPGSIGEPAFPSRPDSAQAAARNEGDGIGPRSRPIRATRSHAQRAPAREHGKAGEHRTFSAVSTMARSSPVGGSHLPNSTPQVQRLRG
jgi:putative transposase